MSILYCLIFLLPLIASARRATIDSAADLSRPLSSQCVTPPPFTLPLPIIHGHHSETPSALHYHTATSTLYLVNQQATSIYAVNMNNPQPAWVLITTLTACAPNHHRYGDGSQTYSAFYDSSDNGITLFVMCVHSISHDQYSQRIQPKSLQLVNIEMGGISVTHTITSVDIAAINCTAPYIHITAADANSVYLMCTSPSTCSTIYHITTQDITIVTDSLQCPSPRAIAAYTSNVIYAACYDASAVEKGTGRLGNGWIARIDRATGTVRPITNSSTCLNPSSVSVGTHGSGMVYAVCGAGSAAISIDPSLNHALTIFATQSECLAQPHILSNPSLGLTYLRCFGQTPPKHPGGWMIMKRDDTTGVIRQVIEPTSHDVSIINSGIQRWAVDQSPQGRIFIFTGSSLYVISDSNKAPPAVP